MKYVNMLRGDIVNRRMQAPGLIVLLGLLLLLITPTVSGTREIITTPVSPKLTSPGSASQTGLELTTLTPELRWEQVFDAQLYSVYVRKFPFAEQDVVFKNEAVTKPPAQIPENVLADGEKYRWYVRAFNKAGWSDRSQYLYFTVDLPTDGQAPTLVAPGSASQPAPLLSAPNPVFRWKSIPAAKKYGLYISKYPHGPNNIVYRNESLSGTSFTLPKGVLVTGQNYGWSMKVRKKTGWSGSSKALYFTLKGEEEKIAHSSSPAFPALPADVVVEGRDGHWSTGIVRFFSPHNAAYEAVQREPATNETVSPQGAATVKPPAVSPSSQTAQKQTGQTGHKMLAQLAMPPNPPARPAAEPPPQPPAQPVRNQTPAQGGSQSLSAGPQRVQAAPPANQSTGSSGGHPNVVQPPRPAAQGAPAGGTPPAIVQAPPAMPARSAPPPPPPAPASPPAPRPGNSNGPAASPGSMVQMQFDNIELRDLIKFVSNIMGRNFIFDENVVKGKATILSPKSLTRDEVFRVFETVLGYYGFSIVQTPEAMKIVKSADAKTQAIDSLDPNKVGQVPAEEKVATIVVPLEYLDSNTMVGIMRPLMARDAYLVSVPATNSLIMIDTSANLQRLKKLITELDIPVSKQLSGIHVYNVQHTTAADLAKTLQSLLAEGKKAATPKEKIFITSYAPTNSLLVSAPPEDLKDIKRIIEDIDTLRPQVLVEAAIMEVSLSKGASLGVEWIGGAKFPGSSNTGVIGGNINPSSALLGLTGAIASGDSTQAVSAASALLGFSIGVIGGTIEFNGKTYPSLAAFVRAVAVEDSVNILSTPQILTINNEEAEIVVGENRPYLTTSRLDSAGNPVNTFDYRDVGVKLKVKPYINKDGLVYLTLYQEVTKVTEATVGSGTNQQPAPTTLKRSTKTTVGVKDSQTIVISGLIRDDSSGRRQGIPFLSAIPVIGYLFGTTSKAYEKTNLLVFITPRIIYNAKTIEEISREKKIEQDRLINQENSNKKE
jgi:general secretion pathway protein D